MASPTKAAAKSTDESARKPSKAKAGTAVKGASSPAAPKKRATAKGADKTSAPGKAVTAKAATAKSAKVVAPTEAKIRRVIPALAKRVPADAKTRPPKREGPLDKFLLGQLRALEEERTTYVRQATSLRAEADSLVAEREPGDVQFDEESGEGDTIAVERERDLTLSAQASAAVEEIDLAIEKIHDGTYGVCDECYTTIPKERLRALPYAALCVQCKSAGFSNHP
jgi:DnaK suppressor protein